MNNPDGASMSKDQAIATLRQLATEVMQEHRDPEAAAYNECDRPNETCMWCCMAQKALAALDDIAKVEACKHEYPNADGLQECIHCGAQAVVITAHGSGYTYPAKGLE